MCFYNDFKEIIVPCFYATLYNAVIKHEHNVDLHNLYDSKKYY
jgi:hypothetical protein